MLLKSVKYSEYLGTGDEWILDTFHIKNINLIVGINGTGKTRSLNVIANLALILKGKKTVRECDYFVEFFDDNSSKNISYRLKIHSGIIEEETFKLGNETLLDRNKKGEGFIYSEDLEKKLKMGISPSQVAVVSKKDSVHHPFLADLCNWAKGVRHYYFGKDMGKGSYIAVRGDRDIVEGDPSNVDDVIATFIAAQKKFGEQFIIDLKRDMNGIGYDIENVGTCISKGVRVASFDEVLELCVKEKDIEGNTEQSKMSQGMFRAFSVLIHANYAFYSGNGKCILLDDIGEGLDYARSNALIKLLVEKFKETGTQLLMTTNDRFVMNSVPLEYWAVLTRSGGRCRVVSKETAPQAFEEFSFTGLNNFDFLTTRFWEDFEESHQ
jgi:hypothetical protein